MREQTIVWRNDFDSIKFPSKDTRGEYSNKAVALFDNGQWVVGYFVKLLGVYDLNFHAKGIAFCNIDCIKEFAFLE